MNAITRRFRILALVLPAVVAAVAVSAPGASAANHCVGLHPSCVGIAYMGTAADLKNALTAANNNASFPGADTVYIGPGKYVVDSTTTLSLTAPLTIIGSGRGVTSIEAGANGVVPLYAYGTGANVADISDLTVRHEGYSTGYGLTMGNGVAHNIDISVIATTGSVRGMQLLSSGRLEDSSITVEGNGAIAVYLVGTGTVSGVQITGTDGLGSGIQSGGAATRTIAETTMKNLKYGVFSDQGPMDIRDVFIDLKARNGAIGLESENSNNCATCALDLDARNITVIGTGANQVGIGVGGTATDDSAENGVGEVVNSYFDLTGTNAKAMRCRQSGANATASLTSSYVAAQPGRIDRQGTCAGGDTDLLDTTGLSIDYNLVGGGDYRPVTGSPLIDAGEPGTVVDPDRQDVDGLPRVFDGNGDLIDRIDIGTYEYQPAMKPAVTFTAAPTPVDAGVDVAFQATASDPDGGAVTVAWDFGDSTAGSGGSTTHAYSAAGDFIVTATATDNEGQSSTATRTVHVNSTPPTTPTAGASETNAFRGQLVTFTASGSTDPDGDTFTYEWTFTGGGSDSGSTVDRAATSVGTFTATVRAVDENNEQSPPASAVVTIDNRPPNVPVITPDVSTAFRGDTFTFTPAATDPDSDALGYQWSYGDGAISGPVGIGQRTHAYSTVGVKTINLAVNDAYGGSNSGSTTVEVLDRAPVLGQLTRTGGSKIGDTQAFGISAIDPDDDPVAFSWNFGDGGTAVGATATHAYGAGGTYTVTASGDDGQGAVVVATTSVKIDPPYVTVAKPTKKFKLGKKAFALGAVTSKPHIPITASSATTATLTLSGLKTGWLKGSKCKAKRPAGSKKRCELKLMGFQTLILPAGSSRASFAGLWNKKKLAPGRYRVTITPAGGAPVSSVVITLAK